MGLDMYLFARGGTNADKSERVEDDEIGYWRKFNALHSLMLEVGGADPDSNCEEIPLTLENLQHIYDICKEVKDILDKAPKFDYDNDWDIREVEVDDPLTHDGPYFFNEETKEQVCKLMEPQDGFFWGDTDIDDFYHVKVTQTIPILEKAIELAKQGEELYYYCWW